MLSSLAEMKTWPAALQMQTRIHSSFGKRSALQTLWVALQLCVVALQLCPIAYCSYPLPLSSGHVLCRPSKQLQECLFL